MGTENLEWRFLLFQTTMNRRQFFPRITINATVILPLVANIFFYEQNLKMELSDFGGPEKK